MSLSLSLTATANVIDTFCVAQKREKGEKERRTRTTHVDYTANATFGSFVCLLHRNGRGCVGRDKLHVTM